MNRIEQRRMANLDEMTIDELVDEIALKAGGFAIAYRHSDGTPYDIRIDTRVSSRTDGITMARMINSAVQNIDPLT